MNSSELSAKEWLTEHGYTGISFRSRRTPDFVTDQGGVEVKTVAGKDRVVFTPCQFETLVISGSKLLIYDKNDGDEPWLATPEEFKVSKYHMVISSANTVTVSDKTWETLALLKLELKLRSMDELMRELLRNREAWKVYLPSDEKK